MNEENVANGLGQLLGTMMIFALVILVIVIVIFIAQAIFLNKLSKLKTGKKSVAAWIPIGNIYAVGKITINKWVGLVVMILYLLSGEKTATTSTTINGVTNESSKSFTLLPRFVGTILSFVILGLYIYAIYQFIMLKKQQKEPNNISNENNAEMTNNDSGINNSSMNTSEVKTDNDNMKNNSQNVIKEPGISEEPLPNVTDNSTQQTTPKQDSGTSPLQDLYK